MLSSGAEKPLGGSLHVHGTEQLQLRSVFLGVWDDGAHLFWGLGGLFLCTVQTWSIFPEEISFINSY